MAYNREKIWRDNQITLGYVSPQLSVPHEERFKLYSIYWPEKASSFRLIKKKQSEAEEIARKISKQIDEEEKNQMRIGKGKNPMRSTFNKTGFLNNKQSANDTFRATKTQRLSQQNQQIVYRLSQNSKFRQSFLRDRHGNRTNIYQNQEDSLLGKLKSNKNMRNKSTGFYTSRRFQLELPHNYYPGPGSYQVKRYLEDHQRSRSSHCKQFSQELQ